MLHLDLCSTHHTHTRTTQFARSFALAMPWIENFMAVCGDCRLFDRRQGQQKCGFPILWRYTTLIRESSCKTVVGRRSLLQIFTHFAAMPNDNNKNSNSKLTSETVGKWSKVFQYSIIANRWPKWIAFGKSRREKNEKNSYLTSRNYLIALSNYTRTYRMDFLSFSFLSHAEKGERYGTTHGSVKIGRSYRVIHCNLLLQFCFCSFSLLSPTSMQLIKISSIVYEVQFSFRLSSPSWSRRRLTAVEVARVTQHNAAQPTVTGWTCAANGSAKSWNFRVIGLLPNDRNEGEKLLLFSTRAMQLLQLHFIAASI